MASAFVVLKHETSTLRQSHNFISIDFTFGVDDYVRDITNPAKFGLDATRQNETSRGGNMYGLCDFFDVVLQQSYTRGPIFAHNSSKDAVWCKEHPFGYEKCVVFKSNSLEVGIN